MARLHAILLLLVLCTGPTRAQDSVPATPDAPPTTDSCTPEKSVAETQESIHVRLWTAATNSSEYSWTVSGGSIEGHGVEAQWDLSGAPTGYATATVRYTATSGRASCSLRIIIRVPAGHRGTELDRGHELLVRDTSETPGFGLYSYVLLSAAPDDKARARCLQLIQAVLAEAPDVEDLGRYYDSKQLNLTYIPVTSAPKTPASAQWLLDNYDYARARFLLHALPGNLSRGPYLVSSLRPLSKATSGPYLVQDLATVPPHLVSLWTSEFLNQTAQEHFWEQSLGSMFALRLRTAIGIMAEGLPDVRKSLNEWISLAK